MEIAELAVRYRDAGVVGFDIAGAEAGFPPTRHLDAFEYLQRENAHFTIHAGEAFGLPSIWQAIQWCGADRLGHGVRIVDDIRSTSDGPRRWAGSRRTCGTSGSRWSCARRRTCRPARPPRSPSTRSGCCATLRFRVTVNTDNRLMSGTSMSREMALLVEAFGYGWDDLQWFTVNAMKSAFIPFDERLTAWEAEVEILPAGRGRGRVAGCDRSPGPLGRGRLASAGDGAHDPGVPRHNGHADLLREAVDGTVGA